MINDAYYPHGALASPPSRGQALDRPKGPLQFIALRQRRPKSSRLFYPLGDDLDDVHNLDTFVAHFELEFNDQRFPLKLFDSTSNRCYQKTIKITYQEDSMRSDIKYSEDIVPITDLKINPARIINQVDKTRRPVLLTSRGRGVAIVESVKDYEARTEEQTFLRGVVQGLMDIEEGREISLTEVKKRLGLGK